MNLKNTLCTMPPWVGISFKVFFNTFNGDPHVDALIKGSYVRFAKLLVRLLQKVATIKTCSLVCRWRPNLESQFGLGESEQTRGRRKLCMLPCHNCYIYETGRRKEVGRVEDFNRGVDPQLFYQNYTFIFYKQSRIKTIVPKISIF